MDFASKFGASLVGVTNLVAACAAFVVWGIYDTFAQWGADGLLYWNELAVIAMGAITLLVCAASFWWKRHSRAFAMVASICSSIVIVFAFLVLIPTIHSRRGTEGFAENMVWLVAPIILLFINLLFSYSRFIQLNKPEVTSWQQ